MSLDKMSTARVLCKGYLTRQTKTGAWRKSYMVLTDDCKLSISDKKGQPPRHILQLDAQSRIKAIPKEELRGDRGFSLTTATPNTRPLIVKSAKNSEIEVWDRSIRNVLQTLGKSNGSTMQRADKVIKQQLDENNFYMNSSTLRRFKSKANITGSGKVAGYVMKVGKGKTSGDYFVNANTLEYFKTEEDCVLGLRPEGKATIMMLV